MTVLILSYEGFSSKELLTRYEELSRDRCVATLATVLTAA